jgi:hypothetical protein
MMAILLVWFVREKLVGEFEWISMFCCRLASTYRTAAFIRSTTKPNINSLDTVLNNKWSSISSAYFLSLLIRRVDWWMATSLSSLIGWDLDRGLHNVIIIDIIPSMTSMK